MGNTWIFVLCCIIGGAGWVATPVQIKYVWPEACVAYRFMAAGVMIFAFAFFKKRQIARLGAGDLVLCALQGCLLFGLNYILVYMAAKYIVSGLIAVCVSLLMVPAMGWRWLIFKQPPRGQDIGGALIGAVGVYLLFARDLRFSNDHTLLGFLMAFGSTFLSSLGMNISEKLKQRNVDLVWATGYGMLLGGGLMFLFSTLRYGGVSFSLSFDYIWSLLYLVVITAVMFPMYLILTGRVGAGRASYVWVATPLISLVFSSIFEAYTFTPERFVGAGLILAGGVFMKIKLGGGLTKP